MPKGMVIALLLLCLLTSMLFAGNGEILIGIGYSELADSFKAEKEAKEQAMADLASQIQARVRAEFENLTVEKKGAVDEYTRSKIRVISDLQIEGVKFEVRKIEGSVQARAFLNKTEARQIYFKKCRLELDELQKRWQFVQQLLNEKKQSEALAQLLEASKIFSELEQNLMIYVALGGQNSDAVRPQLTHAELDQTIHQLSSEKINSISDAVNLLSFRLARQISTAAEFKIFPFEYEDSGFGSAFSEYLRQELTARFGDYFKPQSGSSLQVLIFGNYWISGNKMILLAQAQGPKGKMMGSARVELPMELVKQSGVPFKPANFNQAQKDNAYFDAGKLIYGDLKFSAWTNKGSHDLLFKQGEQLKVFVRVSEPAYLRCIYHLANGMRTPLVENFYIGRELVNKTVEITRDYQIICAPPFGVERLQIFASTEKFPELQLAEQVIDGQEYEILAQDLPTFVAATRGFIRKKKNEARAAERVITITTIPSNVQQK